MPGRNWVFNSQIWVPNQLGPNDPVYRPFNLELGPLGGNPMKKKLLAAAAVGLAIAAGAVLPAQTADNAIRYSSIRW